MPLPVPVTMADSFEVLASAGVITNHISDFQIFAQEVQTAVR
jgi:hypothetical protein